MKTTRTILSSLLALFVLTSSISYSISIHFCGGKAQDVTIFGNAQKCEEHKSICDHEGGTKQASINHKGCCEDTSIKIDSDKYTDKKVLDKLSVDGSHDTFIPSAFLIQEPHSLASIVTDDFLHYRPPLIQRDITLLVQSFLI